MKKEKKEEIAMKRAIAHGYKDADQSREFIDTFIPSRDTRAYLHSIGHEFTDLEKATIVANHRMLSKADKARWLTGFADTLTDEALKIRILNAIPAIEENQYKYDYCCRDLFDFVYIPHDFRHGDLVRGICDDFKTEPYQETVGVILNFFDEEYEFYRNMRGDYSDVQLRVDIKFEGVDYQGEFHHEHINPIYIERMKLREDDERKVYLDYLINVLARKYYAEKNKNSNNIVVHEQNFVVDRDITFGELRCYLSRLDRLSICIKETGDYENFICLRDVPGSYDRYYVYGIGMIDSEFYKIGKAGYAASGEMRDLVFLECIEIMLSEEPKSTVID